VDTVDLHFPAAGLDVSRPAHQQPNRQLPGGLYFRTAAAAENVRGHDPRTLRRRGGARAGLSKWLAATVAGDEWVVQELRVVVGAGFDPPGGQVVQASQSGRVVSLVAVSRGNVFTAVPGATAWTPAVNETGEDPPLNFTGVMQSAPNNQKLYFADGSNWVVYDPATNTVRRWAATAGTLPEDADGNRPRLICTWRGRTVLSGLLLDPHNWFMSRVSDPFDWDYESAANDQAQAVAGNSSPLGLIGDAVTALVPATDDRMVLGTDHEVWCFKGDPAAGGSIDQVTKAVGFAFGEAWCTDPLGVVYFLSNTCGVYRMAPGGFPERISTPVDNLLKDINTGTHGVRLLWADRAKGFHLFVTPLAAPAAATHYFWEQPTGAWWRDSFADPDMDPLCCTTLDGNGPADRVALVGGWDGYVRAVDPDAADDDGEPIESEVWIGPVVTKDFDDLVLKELQPVLGAGSGAVSYAVHAGATAEAALAADPVAAGVLVAGRNLTYPVRKAGHAIYVRLYSSVAWAMESVRAVFDRKGMTRRRGR
jgi:hypothetical protein